MSLGSTSEPDEGFGFVGNDVTEVFDASTLEPVDIGKLVLAGKDSDPAGSACSRAALDRYGSFAAEQSGVAGSEVAPIVCSRRCQFLSADDLEPTVLVMFIEHDGVGLFSSLEEAEEALVVTSGAHAQDLFGRQGQSLLADTNITTRRYQ